MKMILQLLVAAVAVGLTVAGIPEYKQNLAAFEEAADVLQLNLLSMEGDIPFLNDSRRHYAEIMHVIYYHGVRNSGGIVLPYYEIYPKYLLISAPEAINNPEVVLEEIKDLFVTVVNKTSELKDLIDACVQDDAVCNKLIDDTVKENIDQYRHQAEVLFAARSLTNELKHRNRKFEEVSRDFEAHPFVIKSPHYLKGIVDAVSQLFRTINPPWQKNL